MKPAKKKQKVLWLLKGSAIGVALLIPGLSAGTLALIMGIYEKILDSLMQIRQQPWLKQENLWFLFCLSIGAGLSLFLLAQPLSFLIDHFPVLVHSFFAGLIIASLPSLFKMITSSTNPCLGHKSSFLWIAFFTVLFWLCFQSLTALDLMGREQQVLPFKKSSALWIFFSLAGFLSVFTSVLPGLSGSFILVLMGMYHPVLMSLAEREWGNLVWFSIGGVFGLLSAIYVVRLFLKKFRKLFFCMALALILAGLPELLPDYQGWSSLSLVQWAQISFFIFLGAGLFVLLNYKKSELRESFF